MLKLMALTILRLSPIVRFNSIRILISLAVNFRQRLNQLDMNNAFLYGDLSKEVYMEQPLGFVT